MVELSLGATFGVALAFFLLVLLDHGIVFMSKR
jgi:hypothetical protein